LRPALSLTLDSSLDCGHEFVARNLNDIIAAVL